MQKIASTADKTMDAPTKAAAVMANFVKASEKARPQLGETIRLIREGLFDDRRLPPGEKRDVASLKMRTFLENGWENFAKKAAQVTSALTPADLELFGSSRDNERVQAFMSLFTTLDSNGFFDVRGRPICFWSGNSGQLNKNSLSNPGLPDGDILAYRALYFLFQEVIVKEKEQGQHLLQGLLMEAFASAFASHAKGKIHYFSGNDGTGTSKSITVGNYFWRAELPVIQRLRQRGIVESISLHYSDKDLPAGDWGKIQTVDFNDPQRCGKFLLFRLKAYSPPLREEHFPKSPEDVVYANDRYLKAYPLVDRRIARFVNEKWRQFDDRCRDPRPAISINCLRQLLTKWRALTWASQFFKGNPQIAKVFNSYT